MSRRVPQVCRPVPVQKPLFRATVLTVLVIVGSRPLRDDGLRAADAQPTRVNFVIFLTDDQGWGDLGCYGHPHLKTPNIDRFAKQGMRFTQCYAASAFCSPSRSAILTGRTPYRNGVFTWLPERDSVHLRRSEITVASMLRQEGYATCHVGKWHLNGFFNSPEQPQPNDHGYDHWFATQNNAKPSHKNPENFVRNGIPVGPLEGFSAVLVVEEAIRWLEQDRDKAKPFFLTVWTHEPHLPIESDPQFMALYEGDADLRQHHGNISQLDDAFGKLMRALDKDELAADTFVMFTSDNGPEGRLDENGYPIGRNKRTRGSTGGLRGRKRDMYEGGIRVPGIVRWPGKVPVDTVSDEPIIGSDLFSTICDIADLPLPHDRTIDGSSILPALEGKPIARATPLYWRCYIAQGPKVAMRIGDWKILADEPLTEFELYNLKSDPHETNNLVDTELRQFAAMRTQFERLNAEIESEGPNWWRGYLRPGQRQRARPQTSRRSGRQPADIFSRENLVAWCIVPFDAKKRGPAARAEMLKRLGLQRVAYDWRNEHVPTFEEEILQYKLHGLEYFAFWSWHPDMEPLIRKHGIHPQIWITNPSPEGTSQQAKVATASRDLLPLVNKSRELGCKLGLYNHGGWGGEPENLVALCEYLRKHQAAGHVGIVYNFHHGHADVPQFAERFAMMRPYLLCVNVNGMNDNANPKIVTIGQGQHERAMLEIVQNSGYDGPIGILDHRSELDAEQSLRANLEGLLDWQR